MRAQPRTIEGAEAASNCSSNASLTGLHSSAFPTEQLPRSVGEAETLTKEVRTRGISMKRFFQRLTCVLMIAGAMVSLAMLSTPGSVHAATTCTPNATLPADIAASGPLDTG